MRFLLLLYHFLNGITGSLSFLCLNSACSVSKLAILGVGFMPIPSAILSVKISATTSYQVLDKCHDTEMPHSTEDTFDVDKRF